MDFLSPMQWVLVLLLIGLIAAFVIIRKKQNR
jgi:hypothetical protein